MRQIMWDDLKWNTGSNYLGRREYKIVNVPYNNNNRNQILK